jgi:hypothetical protein
MRWREITESPVEQYDLDDALYTWVHAFSKADAWTGGNNELERRIIELTANRPPRITGNLYRGQGVSDQQAKTLLNGGTIVLEPSKRLLTSWSDKPFIAKDFASEAAESANSSAIAFAVPARMLRPVVEIPSIEYEVLAHSQSLTLTKQNLLALWLYDEEAEVSRLQYRR